MSNEVDWTQNGAIKYKVKGNIVTIAVNNAYQAISLTANTFIDLGQIPIQYAPSIELDTKLSMKGVHVHGLLRVYTDGMVRAYAQNNCNLFAGTITYIC